MLHVLSLDMKTFSKEEPGKLIARVFSILPPKPRVPIIKDFLGSFLAAMAAPLDVNSPLERLLSCYSYRDGMDSI